MIINLTRSALYKIVQIILLVVIIGLLLWSQPWSDNSDTTRKITVTGSSTIEAEPDEYTFNPYFERKGTNQETMKSELTAEANKAIDALKQLGVEEDDLKLDVSSYDQWYWMAGEEGILNASIRIKVNDEELVQKVQDYLLTTEAKGQLTPQATFSEAKKKELNKQVTEQAIDDAKEQAELQAKKFDAKVGDVVEVKQAQDTVFPIDTYSTSELQVEDSRSSLPVLPGKNEYSQTVTVTYELQ